MIEPIFITELMRPNSGINFAGGKGKYSLTEPAVDTVGGQASGHDNVDAGGSKVRTTLNTALAASSDGNTHDRKHDHVCM